MTDQTRNFIWLKEAADLLNVNIVTLREWIKKYETIKKKKPDELTESDKKFRCPAYGRMGSRYRFTRESIDKFIKESMDMNN